MNEEIEYQLQPIFTPRHSSSLSELSDAAHSCSFRRSSTVWHAAVDVTGMITDSLVQKSECDMITESVTFEPQQILYLEAFFILGYHRFSIFVSVKSFRWSLSGYKCVRCTNSHWGWWKHHVLSLCFSSFTPLPFPDSAFDSSSSSALISSSLVSFACPLLASLSRFLFASSSPVHLLLLLSLSADLHYLFLQRRI